MVILSFSVKEAELKSGIKIRTTRRYTPEKYALWKRTLDGGDLTLDCWWKSRRPEGYKLFERQGHDLYRVRFVRNTVGGLYPAREWVPLSNDFYLMDPADAERWVREEGFGACFISLMAFFDDHYENLLDLTFQSIAFDEVE